MLFYPKICHGGCHGGCHCKKEKKKSFPDRKTVYLNIFDDYDICYSEKDKKKGQDYLCGWHFDSHPGRPTIVFFHGTTGNITDRAYIINFCNRFSVNLFVFDYSGYGESGNNPSKAFLKENADTVYNYLRRGAHLKNKDIVLWSESLGCFSASYLCSKHKFRACILMSAFSSLDDILLYKTEEGYKRTCVGLVTNILSWKMDFLPVKFYLREAKCKVVVVHSKHDDLIDYECAKINYDSIVTRKKMVTIGGAHSSPIITKEQLKEVFHFCDLDHEVPSNSISRMLHSMETYAQRHDNFLR